MADIFDEITYEETPQGDIFDQIEAESKKSLIKESGRHLARSGSRIAETVLGLPSDILQTVQIGAKGLQKAGGKIRESIGLKPLDIPEAPKGLPGSEDFRNISEKVFGEVVKPQSATESFIDNIVSDAAALAVPIGGRVPFLRTIGTAIAGNVGEKAAKELGFGEKGQAAAKIGSFFLASLAGKGNVKKYWNEQYALAEKAVPERARLSENKLDRQLDKLSRELKKGGIETPSQKFVEKPLNDLKKIINEGELRVEDAVKAKQKINELRAGLFDEVKGKSGQKYARTKINDISLFLDEALESYGKKNPQFYKHYKAANEAYGGYQQSRRVGNWISRNIPFGKLGKTGLVILEGIFKPASLKATVPAFAAFKGGELLTRMFKNKTLRQYYANLMKNAVNENKAGVLRNLKLMETEIEENEPDIFDEISQSS